MIFSQLPKTGKHIQLWEKLSLDAPPAVEPSNLWHGFKAVVILIERDWLDMLMETTIFTRQGHNVEYVKN